MNGEIIYIPNWLNNLVLILFSTISNGEFAIEHFTGKTCEKKSLIYQKIIFHQMICHNLMIKIIAGRSYVYARDSGAYLALFSPPAII
jgi:hypothetical protein